MTRRKPEGFPAALAERLHRLDVPDRELPIRGFPPPDPQWQPRPSAVLVPIVLDEQPGVLLTVRHRSLTKHAGQVALPGGRREADEPFPRVTALRETHEEIGVAPERVELLGQLDRVDTISRFRISPVVGLVDPEAQPQACPHEVSHIFRLPLEWVRDLERYRRHDVLRRGQRFTVWSLAGGPWLVWGATAIILRQLARHLNEID
ncbi:CoA pyrophosphatase [Wenzhouxiangella marina]|uniref:Putative Nudix hydrolase NudL n=1 Tax=Wenzhouxiangella marina TaxID=1579979 RepID=A0A0K0XXN4_9GAMM|nr:CoA pyrophosphatase [Wenzhouxiangella marina]AKS42371.1 putative Nudix hydrolase NudL [Wenzhouxiangella marina]MBB6085856.1 8-oxo-dGTP pyrophosphatase MutT (NUDIX family) [Wenzhouxiangella marina]